MKILRTISLLILILLISPNYVLSSETAYDPDSEGTQCNKGKDYGIVSRYGCQLSCILHSGHTITNEDGTNQCANEGALCNLPDGDGIGKLKVNQKFNF